MADREVTLKITASTPEEEALQQAAIMTGGHIQAYQVGYLLDKTTYAGLDAEAFLELQAQRVARVQAGDMTPLVDMLMAQLSMLNTLCVSEIVRSRTTANSDTASACVRTALTAQQLSIKTSEAIAGLLDPATKARTIITKQANVTSGPQQVNNLAVAVVKTESSTQAVSDCLKTVQSPNQTSSGTTHT